MFDKDFLKKMHAEEALSSAEEAVVDEALRSSAQEAMKSAVKALPDDQPSMTWRSELNGRLLELGKSVEKKRRGWLVWRPALGLGFAGALALVLTLKMQDTTIPPTPSGPSLEAALVDEHMEALNATTIAGAGLASHEAHPTPAMATDELYDWQRSDVESL